MWFTSSLCHPRRSTTRVERTNQLTHSAGMSPERIPPPQGPNLSWLQRPEGRRFVHELHELHELHKVTDFCILLCLYSSNSCNSCNSWTPSSQGASSSGPLARHKPTGSCLSLLPRSPQPHPWHRTSMADRQLFTAAVLKSTPLPTSHPPRMVSRGHLSGPQKLRITPP